eukprot:PhF_6_TR12964/c0_g1_i1/m.20484/K09595/HM13; minor histocompatibility antigen H13
MDAVLALPFVFMLVAAVTCIYIGSYRSLSAEPSGEQIDQKAALRFPIIGSCVLFGLYILYKYIPKEYLNLLLSVYFCALGTFAISQVLRPHLGHNILSGVISLAVCAAHFYFNHWITNNVLGVAFCISAIQMVPISSVRVGALLLGLLFFYDIFWVFGTEVMVKVATSIDGPVKLVFPKDILAEEYKFSLLGLGDIVLPGFYVALMLRMDKVFAQLPEGVVPTKTPYFTAALVSYTAGLLNTFGVMLIFKAAQPALLYLVPWCVGGTAIRAVSLGQFSKWWAFEEDLNKGEEEVAASYLDEAYNVAAELFGWEKKLVKKVKNEGEDKKGN